MKARGLSLLFALAALALPANASAFCRATTCDPGKRECARDASSCLTEGKPLFWGSSCVQVYVQGNGSPLRNVDFPTLMDSVSRAFGTWLAADCGGASPLLDVQVLGPISCDRAEYNKTKRNANIVMFRDDQWPYKGGEDALAFTHLLFNADTGELWDSDLEINSFEFEFSTDTPPSANDLDSMLTHEVGHMLGLGHTLVKDATMYARYVEGTDSLRTLAADDASGLCAIYPPDRVPSRTSCAPRHGFSDLCAAQQSENSGTNEGTEEDTGAITMAGRDPVSKGCALGPSSSPSGATSALLSALALAGVALRRRQQRHQFVSCGPRSGQR